MNFGLRTGNLVLVIVLVGIVVGTLCWMRYLPDSPMARLFISRGTIGNIGAEQPELVGRTGTALTTLRPSGAALIEGQRVDVVSEGQMIQKGSQIKVIATEGLRVVVRAMD
jgi:membrane-bound serine protease (ClpP class)